VTHRAAKRPAEPRDPVEIVQGLRAGLAVFARRREDIIRIAFGRVRAAEHAGAGAANSAFNRELHEVTRWAASRQVPCTEMRDAELDRFAESTHHEGLCVVARPRRWLSTSDLGDALARNNGAGLALDRVRNPYNVGAMIRTAAFFGLDAVLLGAPAPHPGLAPAAVRVAEGGAEHLKLARTTDLADTLSRLRARGVRVIGADARASASEGGSASGQPVLLVVGNEREGLGDRVRAACDGFVAVRGSGAVESLNVAVAAGILIAAVRKLV